MSEIGNQVKCGLSEAVGHRKGFISGIRAGIEAGRAETHEQIACYLLERAEELAASQNPYEQYVSAALRDFADIIARGGYEDD